jgi:hypothetical protein
VLGAETFPLVIPKDQNANTEENAYLRFRNNALPTEIVKTLSLFNSSVVPAAEVAQN